MRIACIEHLYADHGTKRLCFLKISCEDGRVGWSEYSEILGGGGLAGVIAHAAEDLPGADPRDTAGLSQRLAARMRSAAGGLNAQAAAALENACLDLKAKAYGVPVHQLFGGALREQLPVYWSHFGSYRAQQPAPAEHPPLRSLDDLARLARSARDRGFRAIKSNILLFEDGQLRIPMPGFGRAEEGFELEADHGLLHAIVQQLACMRDAAGPGLGIALDMNFNCKPAAVRRIAKALEPFGLAWLETDLPDAAAMAAIRASTSTPLASLETALRRRDALPYLMAGALDYAIVDVMWTGMSEAVRLAALADAFDVNINSQAFSSPLAAVMGAHLCALAPNSHLVEFDVDGLDWMDALFVEPVRIDHGMLRLPERPGWGLEPNESALQRRVVQPS